MRVYLFGSVFLQFTTTPPKICISAERHCTYDLGYTVLDDTHKLNELLSIHY
jgi:hypothetical protein